MDVLLTGARGSSVGRATHAGQAQSVGSVTGAGGTIRQLCLCNDRQTYNMLKIHECMYK